MLAIDKERPMVSGKAGVRIVALITLTFDGARDCLLACLDVQWLYGAWAGQNCSRNNLPA
jgi:hypothetical protein